MKKHALVLGSGKSGNAAALLLLQKNLRVTITDDRWNTDSDISIPEKLKNYSDINFIKWSDSPHQKVDFAVISPGLDPRNNAVERIKQRSIPVISELELGSYYCPQPMIAITGTNGKTTVTEMVTAILNRAGYSAWAVGNIGEPLSSFALNGTNADYLVCEVSSYQLEHSPRLNPRISVILNISEDHLDRYDSFCEYALTKWSIYKNSSEKDTLIIPDELCHDSPYNNYRMINTYGLSIRQKNENFSRAITAHLGISELIIQHVLSQFPEPAHRREIFLEHKGITFINDSKSTNCHALENALLEISRPVILIAGGRDKEMDFKKIENLVFEKVKHIILMGESREKLAKIWNRTPHTYVDNIDLAAEAAISKAQKGDVVLLSPACASLDQFTDYKQRGNLFKEAICKKIMKITN